MGIGANVRVFARIALVTLIKKANLIWCHEKDKNIKKIMLSSSRRHMESLARATKSHHRFRRSRVSAKRKIKKFESAMWQLARGLRLLSHVPRLQRSLIFSFYTRPNCI